jgi:SAM-dependent methyltransferase
MTSVNGLGDIGQNHFPSDIFRSGEEFSAQANSFSQKFAERRGRERALANSADDPVRYHGHCGVCDKDVEFTCDWAIFYTHADGSREPVWRERLVCSNCGLNTRLRAALHFMLANADLDRESHVYLSEQTTPFFSTLKRYTSYLVGSEYLRDGTARGAINAQGWRHEDITALSFDGEQFDIVGSFEVLEHVPDYKAGLAEMYRVLKPGGHLIATFPFRADLLETLTRARIGKDGEIEHILPPEYHGDPLDDKGVLCFYHFGWDILDTMRSVGFSEAECHYYWSWEEGYLGGALPQFHAVK